MRETKNVKKKIKDLKLPIIKSIQKTLCKRHLKVEISLAFLTYVGKDFQNFAAKNENEVNEKMRMTQ